MEAFILISRGTSAAENYINAIKDAGGTCEDFYLPEYDKKYGGLILAGGGDIHPDYLTEVNMGSRDIDTRRDLAEFKLISKFIAADKPIFGICRGVQVLNVYFGGSLIQDLSEPYASAHRAETGDVLHLTKPVYDSPLYRMFGAEFMTNSAHHQAIREPGTDIEIIQRSDDGTIEGIRHNSYMAFGVQWHPERMCSKYRRADAPDTLPLFKRFLNICAGSGEFLI